MARRATSPPAGCGAGGPQELTGLQQSARWAEARVALQHANARLGGGAPADLRRRLDQAQRDLHLVIQLDAIRLRRVTSGELAYYKAQADRAYAVAFQEKGPGRVDGPPQRMAALVNASAVREALVAALLDWAVCAVDKAQRGWLLEVARQTDSHPDVWRERVLDQAAWEDTKALAELARTADVANQSVSVLLALGERLRSARRNAVPLLQRVQQEHPADFWANLILGNAVLYSRTTEAGGYYRAALASRPGAAVGYCAVGDVLRLQNSLPEATDYYRKSLQHDPEYSRAHSNLGLVLQTQDRLEEAIDCYRRALQLDPDYAWAHHNLGNALRAQGRLGEAYDHYRQMLRVDPKNPEVHHAMAGILVRQGRGPEAKIGWRTALDANPPEHTAWLGYAELCLFLGQAEEYRRTRRTLLDRFGTTTSPSTAEPIAERACCSRPPGTNSGRPPPFVDARGGCQGIDPGMDLPLLSVRPGPGRVSSRSSGPARSPC